MVVSSGSKWSSRTGETKTDSPEGFCWSWNRAFGQNSEKQELKETTWMVWRGRNVYPGRHVTAAQAIHAWCNNVGSVIWPSPKIRPGGLLNSWTLVIQAKSACRGNFWKITETIRHAALVGRCRTWTCSSLVTPPHTIKPRRQGSLICSTYLSGQSKLMRIPLEVGCSAQSLQ